MVRHDHCGGRRGSWVCLLIRLVRGVPTSGGHHLRSRSRSHAPFDRRRGQTDTKWHSLRRTVIRGQTGLALCKFERRGEAIFRRKGQRRLVTNHETLAPKIPPLVSRLPPACRLRADFSGTAKGINHPCSGKVFLVIRHHDTVICLSDSSHDGIECAPGSSHSCALRHQPAPDEGCLFVECQHATAKKSLRSIGRVEPLFQFFALLAGRFLQDSATDFSQAKRGDEQSRSAREGAGFTALLMIFVSSRYRVTD
jgi:hypothetical protein